MKATIFVRLKREVLDPQGDAVKRALIGMGHGEVQSVRIGKLIELEIVDAKQSTSTLREQLEKMAETMLANAVIEDYEVSIEE